MNGRAAWPPQQPSGTRRRHSHRDRRPPERSQSLAHHQTRLAGSTRSQGRDGGRPSSSHHRRTKHTRPEENLSSRASAGTASAAAGWGGATDTPGGRSEPGGWDHPWGGASSCAAIDGSARRSRRNRLHAALSAFIAFFRIKSGVKHAEKRAVTTGGRQAAAVSPIPTAAGTPDWSGRSNATDSNQGLRHHRRRTTAAAMSPIPKTVSEASGSVRSYYTRDSTRGASRYQAGWSTGAALTMDDILSATDNFSSARRIGKGEFASVYKGVLPDGKVVAIKRARKDSGDQFLDPEFQSEVSILPHVTHLNLVRFLGYVEGRSERVIVVEYIPNGTLREHLDGVYGNTLDFLSRLSIAVDIAHAVTYLHSYADHPIIHRNIKASNILLTRSLRAKVGDFGLARLGPSEGRYVVTGIKGTTGYLDPDYLKTQQLTDKSDVYAFGVLLVELLSGRCPIERRRSPVERVTVDWAVQKFQRGKASEVLDPNIPKSPAANLALERMLDLASQCLTPTKQGRPTMKDCGKFLMGIRKEYTDLPGCNPHQPEVFKG